MRADDEEGGKPADHDESHDRDCSDGDQGNTWQY